MLSQPASRAEHEIDRQFAPPANGLGPHRGDADDRTDRVFEWAGDHDLRLGDVEIRDAGDDGDWLERQHAEALELGLDCVVEVRDEEELELALERLDPEIFLLAAPDRDDHEGLGRALELLPDIPAGKLAVADVPLSSREQVDELERAGVDAVIVGARDVAELVGDGPPQV